jgi:ferredoxin-type protein NapF
MASRITRSQFLRGDLSGRRGPLRPPWALPEAQFVETCTACGECVRACPQRILESVRGLPVVSFARGECTFCGACIEVCKPRALSPEARAAGAPPWNLRASIAENCVAHRNVVCRTCLEVCTARAIAFEARLGGAALPQVINEACTGCGACVAPCPAHAISIVRAP